MSDAATQTKTQSEFTKFGRQRIEPGAYQLDFDVLRDICIKVNGRPYTFGQIYVELRASKIKEMPGFTHHDKYVTETGDVVIDCRWPIAHTLRELIQLTRQGIEPTEVTWFYYDHDWSRDADEGNTFFAVWGDKIVNEGCHVSSEQPAFLKRKQDNDPIWHSHPYLDQAWEIRWYRKFYTETLAGQLMVLRPDEPILYHYDRPAGRDVVPDLQYIVQFKTYRLLWVTIPLLAAIAMPQYGFYLLIVAGLLFIDFLWKCWALRDAK